MEDVKQNDVTDEEVKRFCGHDPNKGLFVKIINKIVCLDDTQGIYRLGTRDEIAVQIRALRNNA